MKWRFGLLCTIVGRFSCLFYIWCSVYIFGHWTLGLLLLPSAFWLQMHFSTISLLHSTYSQSSGFLNKHLIIMSLTIHIYGVLHPLTNITRYGKSGAVSPRTNETPPFRRSLIILSPCSSSDSLATGWTRLQNGIAVLIRRTFYIYGSYFPNSHFLMPLLPKPFPIHAWSPAVWLISISPTLSLQRGCWQTSQKPSLLFMAIQMYGVISSICSAERLLVRFVASRDFVQLIVPWLIFGSGTGTGYELRRTCALFDR